MTNRAPEQVILVDADDNELGVAEKMKAHRDGLLHRAFSVFLFNEAGEMLLQRRARTKYHSRGLWANACCSHPRPGEDVSAAARRRIQEELRIECPIEPAFSFVYQANVGGGLREHELDHVVVGHFEGDPSPDPDEVEDWKWVGPDELLCDVARNPDAYAVWFKIALPRLLEAASVA